MSTETATEALPTFMPDGRASRIVKASELATGDVILGWQGEPWTFGTVASVERTPVQSYGAGPILHLLTITYVGEQPTSYRVDPNGWRRIAV